MDRPTQNRQRNRAFLRFSKTRAATSSIRNNEDCGGSRSGTNVGFDVTAATSKRFSRGNQPSVLD